MFPNSRHHNTTLCFKSTKVIFNFFEVTWYKKHQSDYHSCHQEATYSLESIIVVNIDGRTPRLCGILSIALRGWHDGHHPKRLISKTSYGCNRT